jgi:hypothetical protein
MDSVGLNSKCNISAGVDKQSRSSFSVLSSQLRTFADDAHRFAGQGFQFARAEIFFPKLNVVDTGSGGFSDFLQQAATAGSFAPGECPSVRDVVEKAGVGHQLAV